MDRKQCEGCIYFNSGDGNKAGYRFCNHMLYTGKPRWYSGDRCYSRATIKKRRRGSPFDAPPSQQ